VSNRLIHGGLVALEADTRVQTAGELPKRLNVAPWGVHDTAKGRITIGQATLRNLPVAQKAANFDRVALDFNHNTVPGSEAYAGEPAKVAAWGVPTVESGVGIILDALDFTSEGAAAVQGRHYIDLSPTLQLDANGETVFIHSAALCRQGAIPGLSLFSADILAEAAAKESTDFRVLLCLLLGLDTSADDLAINAAAKKLWSASILDEEEALAQRVAHNPTRLESEMRNAGSRVQERITVKRSHCQP